jgi:hypothetical protein
VRRALSTSLVEKGKGELKLRATTKAMMMTITKRRISYSNVLDEATVFVKYAYHELKNRVLHDVGYMPAKDINNNQRQRTEKPKINHTAGGVYIKFLGSIAFRTSIQERSTEPNSRLAENTSNILRFAPSSCSPVVAVHEVVLGSLAQVTFLVSTDGTSADHLLDLVAVTKGVGGKHGGDNWRMFDTGCGATNKSRG